MKYYVNYKVEGRWFAEVEAASLEEAKRLAEDKFYDADFGELHDIGDCDTRQISVEDDDGNIIWED